VSGVNGFHEVSLECVLCRHKRKFLSSVGNSPHIQTPTLSVSIPVEITAATILVTFWDDNVRAECFSQLPRRATDFNARVPLAQASGRLYRCYLLSCLRHQRFRGSVLWRMSVLLLLSKEYDLIIVSAEFIFAIIKRTVHPRSL
jgi:hypothetical protein